MDFVINDEELAALCGLPHLQQLAYLRGIRPYMDVITGITGIKRGISYQSIAEQLYIEPHTGIKSGNCSRAQIRRALASLDRVGLIIIQSQGLTLILKCLLATKGYCIQNKGVTNQSQQSSTYKISQHNDITNNLLENVSEAVIANAAQAGTPLKEENYIYLLSQFEKFWSLYPEKKSKPQAWQAFQRLTPDESLFNHILHALEKHIQYHEASQLRGTWVPPWKYPANWLAQQCWEDEITMEKKQENAHAKPHKTYGNASSKDMFWDPTYTEDEPLNTNVIQFLRRRWRT